MGQNIKLFVALPSALRPFVALVPELRLYTLRPDSDLAVLPFDEELQDRLHDQFGTGDWPEGQGILLSTTDQKFAAECSQIAPVAYLQCDDGSDGCVLQSATVWQLGQITIGPITLDTAGAGARRAVSLRPANVALRALGVIADPRGDETATFGLADYASNEDVHARAWPLRL